MIKKALLILLSIIVLGVIVFLLVGYFNPSLDYETRITIDRPRQDVWRLFNDETKMGEWLKGFKSIETISGERNTVGSKYKLRFSQDGRDFEMIEEMKEFRPPEAFGFRLSSDFFSDEVRVVFIDKGDKTEVVQSDHVVGNNILCKSLLYWMKSHISTEARSSMENLKKYIESTK